MVPARPLIVVLGPPPRSSTVANEIADVVHRVADVATARDPEAMAALVHTDERDVSVVVIIAEGLHVDETVEELDEYGAVEEARVVVISKEVERSDVGAIVDTGRLAAVVTMSQPGIAGWIVGAELREWMLEQGEGGFSLPNQPGAPTAESAMMATLRAEENVVLERLYDALSRALGPRPKLHLPNGTRLTRQGEINDGVYFILEGRVALTRSIRGEDLLLHHASTGPLVGMLSLTRRQAAYFTATATTDVVAIHVSVDQLDRALRLAPELGVIMASLSMRSLSARLVRSEELQFEMNQLIRELDAERARLAKALKELEEARLELVSQARFATLGELSAGVAHELNNPVAAINGVANHIPEDLLRIVEGHPQQDLLQEILATAADRTTYSTSAQRALRRQIEKQTGDSEFAWSITGAGLSDLDLALRVHRDARDAGLGAAVLAGTARNIDVATTRIRELVSSLRAYSRPEGEVVDDVCINVTIDDALQLLSHRLRGIEVVREYQELPPISARPSKLGQVWTNIIVNAADALEGQGRITISTRPRNEGVEAVISDNGPGIAPDVLPRIFEPRFSTKKGTIRYGLGLGMGISRRIVEEHGGSLTATSEPGHTEMTVYLPVSGPSKEEE